MFAQSTASVLSIFEHVHWIIWFPLFVLIFSGEGCYYYWKVQVWKEQMIYKYNVTGITRNCSRLHPRWFSHCQTFCKRLYNVCPNGTSLRLSLLSILPLSGLLQEPGAGCGLTQRVGRPGAGPDKGTARQQEPDKGTARPPRPHTARIGSKE
jgi:hypothetical protein